MIKKFSIMVIICTLALSCTAAVHAESDKATYRSSDAFNINANDGSNHWLWQYYNVTENTYSNMTMKHQDEHDADGSYPDYWLLPNPYASGDANNHSVCAAVGKEIMRGDYFGPDNDPSGKPIKYAAVKTFIVPADGTVTLTHNIFKNIEAGQSRAKIMLNDKQIWPAEGWALSEYNGGFPDYPQDGVVTDVSRGDLIRFVFYNQYEADLGNGETGGRYNGGGKWDPVVTIGSDSPIVEYSALTKSYISSEAFTLDKNDGSNHWLWQSYDVHNNKYITMTEKIQEGENDPARWRVMVHNGNGDESQVAVGAQMMWPDNLEISADVTKVTDEAKGQTRAAVKTFIVPADGTVTLTNNMMVSPAAEDNGKTVSAFRNSQGGRSRAKIMLNDKQIWPKEGWALSEWNGGFSSYPSGGLVVQVKQGDAIRFVFYNQYEAKISDTETGGRYCGGGHWDPIVTLKSYSLADGEMFGEAQAFYSDTTKLLTATIPVHNTGKDSVRMRPILAMNNAHRNAESNLFIADELEKVSVGNNTELAAGKTEILSVAIDLSDYNLDETNYIFSLMLWESTEGMKPLMKKACFYDIK